MSAGRTAFILGVSSDIGRALAERYVARGWAVAGTYRNAATVADLIGRRGLTLYACDVADPEAVRSVVEVFGKSGEVWDTFVSAVGTEEPIAAFFDCDFDEWETSVIVNTTAQLRALHGLHRYRRMDASANVVFFAGGGTNNAFRNYSAYCVSKIALIKMCELLDDENPDLNVFIIGPGFVRTKIHRQTLDQPVAAGPNYDRLLKFLETPGTAMDDIDACITWCVEQGRAVAGGRNFSVVHDPWRDNGAALAASLAGDLAKFKLRRFRNTE